MINPGQTFTLRRCGALALFAALAAALAPAVALAQDPAADQYSPASSSGAAPAIPAATASDPSDPGGRVPFSAGGTNGGPDAFAGAAPSTGSGSNHSAAPGAGPGVTAPAAPGESATAPRPGGSDPTATATTERFNAASERSGGMGIALWIIAGATLLWAVASGATNLRARPAAGPDRQQTASPIPRSDPGKTPNAPGGQTA